MDGPDALVMEMTDIPYAKKRHPVGAIVAFFSEIIRFIVIPMLILYIVIDALSQSNITLLLSKEESDSIASFVILFGGLVAIFAALEAYHQKGSKARMAYGVITIAMLCAWFWFILSSRTIRFNIGEWNAAINITGLVVMMMFAVALKALIPIAQFYASRGRFTSSLSPPAAAAVAATAAETTANPKETEEKKITRRVKEEPPPPDDFMIACPSCKKKIPASADTCPHCKTWIRQKIDM